MAGSLTSAIPPASPPSPVKKFTRAVLLSSPKGVMLRSFCREYTKLVNSQFPWRELGHGCPLDLLRAMNDVVRVEMARDGSVTLFGIGSESMFMPSWVKKAQGFSKTQILPPSRTTKPSFDHYSGAVLTPLDTRPCCNHSSDGPNGAQTSEVRKATRDKSHGPPRRGELFFCSHTEMKRNGFERSGGTLAAEVSRRHTQPGKGGSGCTGPRPPTSNLTMQSLHTGLKPSSHGQSCEQSQESAPQRYRSPSSSYDYQHSTCLQERTLPGIDLGHHAGLRGASVSSEDRDSAVPKSTSERSGDGGGGCVSAGGVHVSMSLPRQMCFSREFVCAPCTESLVGKEVVWQFSGWAVANSRGLTPVVASEVYSPEKLWLQLTVNVEKDLKEISRGIREANPSQLTTVSEGDICCIRVPSTMDYRRAIVKQLKLHVAPQKQAVVQFIDVGTDHVIVPMTHLHTLPSPFSLSSLPPLALLCRLWGVASTCVSGHWWELDSQLLRKLVHRKQVYARSWGSKEKTGSEQVDLFLDSDGLQNVAETLVREGDYMSFLEDHEEEDEEEVGGRPFLFTEVRALAPLPQAQGAVVGGTLLHSPWQRLQRTLANIDGPSA